MAFFAPKVTMFQLNKAGSSWISLGSSGYLIMARSPTPEHPDKSGEYIYSTIADTLNTDKHCRYNKLDYTTIEILWWDIALLSRNKHLHYSIKYGFKKKGDSAVVTKAFNLRTQKTEIIAIRFGSNDRVKICESFRNTFWSILEDLCEDKKTLYNDIKLEHWWCVACDGKNYLKINKKICSFCKARKPSPYHIIKDHVIQYDEDQYDDKPKYSANKPNKNKKYTTKKIQKINKKPYDPYHDDEDDDDDDYDDDDDDDDDEDDDDEDDDDDDDDDDDNDLVLRYDWVCPSCHHGHNKKWKHKKINCCDICLYNCPFIMDECKHCQQFIYLGMDDED